MILERLALTTAFALSFLAFPGLASADPYEPCAVAEDECLANAQTEAELAACDDAYLECSACVDAAEACFDAAQTDEDFFVCDAALDACTPSGGGGDIPDGGTGSPPCEQARIDLAVSLVTYNFYVKDPAGLWVELTNDYLEVYFGTSLSTVELSITPMLRTNSSWFLGVDDLRDTAPTFWLSGTRIVYTLQRPSATNYFVDLFARAGRPVPVPDLVLEPQTGCPPDPLDQ